ncbi:MAG: type II toxin-antitoxin system RelE/ParE family toxin [Pirellulales bacterium]
MDPMPLEIIADAERDIDETFEWYLARSSDAAANFILALNDAMQRISAQPELWPAYDENTRSCPLRKYPFRVVFMNLPDRVRVIAVAHLRRSPGYWKGRA